MSDATTMFDYKGEIFSGRELLAIEVGREIEKERIIKLLEELWKTTYAQGPNYPGSNAVLTAIALIKGEK